MHQLKAHT